MNPELLAIEAAMKDLEFQLSNIQGWISVSNYETAEIKALYLIKAAVELKGALRLARLTTKTETL